VKGSPLVRALMASIALSAAMALPGCNTSDGPLPMSAKAARPLSDKMVKDIESKNMDKESPILVRSFKEESELEVWKQDRTGRYALLKTYPICRWSGELGPKIKEGDRQAPEGFYNISPGQMNPNSQYYLSFDLGYPNAFDRAHGRTGAQLMVHGDCSSRGCYSMTDEQISEIYALGRDAFFGGQKSFQVQAYPFRMTAQNFAKHRDNPNVPFWKMLKKGNDHFEVTQQEPRVSVCEKRYVFDAEARGGRGPLSFSASGKCPAYEVPEDIASAVHEKERGDEIQIAELSRRGTPVAPVRTGADGGMHPVFVAAVKRNQIGVAPQEALFVSTPPGTIPATVRPPRLPELAGTPAMENLPTPSAAKPEPATRMAIAEPEKPAARSTSFFGSLFSFKSDKPAEPPAEKPAEKKPPLLSRMATMVGLKKPESKADSKADSKDAASKPQTRVATHGAIKSKTAEAMPPKPAEARAEPQPAVAPAPAAAPPPAQAPASSAMSGAAPVVPAGTFDGRWSGMR
jgi:murein L,D-transpeptidase YafK